MPCTHKICLINFETASKLTIITILFLGIFTRKNPQNFSPGHCSSVTFFWLTRNYLFGIGMYPWGGGGGGGGILGIQKFPTPSCKENAR
jgi:hypothetical protein